MGNYCALKELLSGLLKCADLTNVHVDGSVLSSFGDVNFEPAPLLDDYVEASNNKQQQQQETKASSSQTIVSDVARDQEDGVAKTKSAFLTAPTSLSLIGDHLKLTSVMRQASSNEKDIRKVMSLFDEIMGRVNEFNNKADELHTRLHEVEKWKPKISEQVTNQINTLRDDLTELEGDVNKRMRKMRQDQPSWLELNAIVERNAEENVKIIVDRVVDKAGGGDIVHLAQVFWSDHEKTNILSKKIDEIEAGSSESLKQVSEDIMAQLDSFDTALTRVSVDQDAELGRLAKSHENLRRVVCELGESGTGGSRRSSLTMTTSAAEMANRLVLESIMEPIRNDLDDVALNSKEHMNKMKSELEEVKSEQISLCKALQFMRDNVRSATSIHSVGLDNEAVENIQDTLVDMDAKFRKVKQLVDDLLDSDQAKHNTLDDLQGVMMNIQNTIVTRDMFDTIIKDKADKDDLSDTVNRVDLDVELEKFAIYMQELSNKLNDDELKSRAARVDESVLETMCKKDDVNQLTHQIERRILSLESLVDKSLKKPQSTSAIYDAAGAKKHLVRCLSCDRKRSQSPRAHLPIDPNNRVEGSVPMPDAMPMKQSTRAYLSFDLDKMRQMRNDSMTGFEGYDNAIADKTAQHKAVRQRNEEMMRDKREEKIKVGRACGGRHTLQCEAAPGNRPNKSDNGRIKLG